MEGGVSIIWVPTATRWPYDVGSGNKVGRHWIVRTAVLALNPLPYASGVIRCYEHHVELSTGCSALLLSAVANSQIACFQNHPHSVSDGHSQGWLAPIERADIMKRRTIAGIEHSIDTPQGV